MARTGSLSPVPANTGGHTAQFRVYNNDDVKITVSLACSYTGQVTSCSAPGSSTIYPESYKTVNVTFGVGTGGTGTITLTGTDNGHSANDSHPVQVVAHGPLTLDGTVNPSTLLERSACVTSGAGPAGAFQCGSLLLTHTMPAYRSRDRERTLTLVYNSATARPYLVLMGDVWLDGIAQPDSFRTTVLLGGQSYPAGWQGAGLSGSRSRFAHGVYAGAGGAALGTGVHDYVLETRNYYGTTEYYDQARSHDSELIVVDRNTSPYGAGWWIAGVSELHTGQPGNRLLAVEADGSAAVYDSVAPNVWKASAGAFQDTIEYKQLTNPNPDSTELAWFYERRLQDGTRIYYNGAGQQRYVTDRLGNVVRYAYRWAALGAGLSQIRIAPWADNLVYTFGYDGAGRFDYVDDPAGRRLDVAVSGNLLANIQPVGNSSTEKVTFIYHLDGRIKDRFSPRDARTRYAYYGDTPLLQTTTLPPTSAGTGVITYRPIQARGLSIGTAPFATAPASQTTVVVDGPRTEVGDSAVFWVNRLGAPTRIRNAVGEETTIVYDSLHPLLIAEMDEPDGTRIRQRWDASARLEMTKDLDVPGAADSVTYAYDDADAPEKPSRIVGPRGDVASGDTTTLGYNADGTLDMVTAPDGHVTRFTYEQGQVKTVKEEDLEVYDFATNTTSVQDLSTTLVYGTNRNLRLTISPAGDTTEIVTRDPYGNITEVKSPEERKQTFQYDARNRRTHVHQWEGATQFTTETEYDASDNVEKVTDPRGLERTWLYDGLEQPVQMTDSRGYSTSTHYDLAGNVDWQKDRQGDSITTKYDAMNRPTERILGEIKIDPGEEGTGNVYDGLGIVGTLLVKGDTITWTYDAGGRADTAENAASRVVRTYDSRGLMTKEVQTLGAWAGGSSYTQDYNYDLAGNRKSWTWPYSQGQTIVSFTYGYGAGNRLESVTGVGRTATLVWDGLGRRRQLSYGSGSTTQFRYDMNGRLGRVHSTHTQHSEDPVDRRYSYDADGNLLREEEHGERRITTNGYDLTVRAYDGRSFLTNVDVTRASSTSFTRYHYDSAGNRTGVGGADSTVHLVSPLADFTYEIRSSSNVAIIDYYYDRNGNEIAMLDGPGCCPPVWRRFYNAAAQFVGTSTNQTWYRYDPFGRRVGVGAITGTGATRVVFDGDNVAFYGDGLGGSRFTHGPGLDDPLFVNVPSSFSCFADYEYYYVTTGGRLLDFQNATGHDCADPSVGGIFATYGDKSGAIANSRDFNLARAGETASETEQFAFFRNRYYNGETGKFSQEDPIGFAGGINLYNYAGNNPATYSDPFGLCPVPLASCFEELESLVNSTIRGIVDTAGAFVGEVSGAFSVFRVATGEDPISGQSVGTDQRLLEGAMLGAGGAGRIVFSGKKVTSGLARLFGIGRRDLGKRIEAIKEAAHLRGAENVNIDEFGNVIAKKTEEIIGNIHDELPRK